LAQERKAERDRLAKEFIEKLAGKEVATIDQFEK
jgi:hypothetical protein